MGHISNNLNGDEGNVSWTTGLDDSKTASHVGITPMLKKSTKSLNKRILLHEVKKEKTHKQINK